MRKDSCILCIDENVNFPSNGFKMAWMIFPRNNILAFYVYNDFQIMALMIFLRNNILAFYIAVGGNVNFPSNGFS